MQEEVREMVSRHRGLTGAVQISAELSNGILELLETTPSYNAFIMSPLLEQLPNCNLDSSTVPCPGFQPLEIREHMDIMTKTTD